MSDICPKCKAEWKLHDFGVPSPYCPSDTEVIESLRAQVETLQSENARLKAMPLASDSVRAVIYGETIDKLGVQIAGNISEIVDLTKQNALLTLQAEKYRGALEAALPMILDTHDVAILIRAAISQEPMHTEREE